MDSLLNFNNLNSCCRTCLINTCDRMFINIFAVRNDSLTIAEMLASCTSIKVCSSDKLPKNICVSCYNCLHSFYDFKKLAENVNTKLWDHFQECQLTLPHNASNVILTEMKIKTEDLGTNDYHVIGNVETSENNLENADIGSSELGSGQFDDTTHLQDTNDEVDAICYGHNETRTQILQQCKSMQIIKSYTCDICSVKIRCRNEFISHLVTHREGSNLNSEIMENNKQSVKCDVCSAMFQSINSLSAHKRKHVSKDRILSCSICKKIFKKISHLKRHEMCHENKRPYKCSICAKSFTSETVLNEHVNEHNGIKPHECPLCLKSFSHVSTLNNHIKKIHVYSEKKYLCPTCGKKFDSSSNLNQHVLRHTGLKMFTCSLCPRKFVSKGELKCHGTTHSGQRSYTCDECGAAFTKCSALGRHKLRHTGIKPYHCDACSTNFTSKGDLKRHHRMHTGEKPYRCVICERAFSQNSDLIRHRRIHCGDNQYRCTQCTMTFRLKSELHRHISEHFISSQLPEDVSPDEDLTKISNNESKCDNSIVDNKD